MGSTLSPKLGYCIQKKECNNAHRIYQNTKYARLKKMSDTPDDYTHVLQQMLITNKKSLLTSTCLDFYV